VPFTLSLPTIGASALLRAVPAGDAVDAVSRAFVAHYRGEWEMPSKVYVGAYPAGDFRAMPAQGGGLTMLKWVTSFPGNPAQGLPTVMALVIVSSAEDGRPLALLEGATVTALRTGAAAVLAAEVLARRDAASASVIGLGPNGLASARAFLARGRRDLLVWDIDAERTAAVAEDLGVRAAGSQEEALAADIVVTVTPGHEPLFPEGSLRPGQHVSLMGADGPGTAEIASAELTRCAVFCDSWEQASHGGELAHAVEAGLLEQEQVRELGCVLAGDAPGRQSDTEITVFDSTGLAIQDLAIATLAVDQLDGLGTAQVIDLS
jgi:alanine dehydrogenase